MAQRITRAKDKIKAARIPYRVPSARTCRTGSPACSPCSSWSSTRATWPGPGDEPLRADLTAEAIRLARLLRALLPDDGEVAGLLALMLLTEARRTARVSASGELVTLAEQDRGAWDRGADRRGPRPGPRTARRRGAGAGPVPAAGRDQCRAHRRPRPPATPTGRRSSRSTTGSSASTRRRSCGSTGPSRSPRLDGPEVALAEVGRA